MIQDSLFEHYRTLRRRFLESEAALDQALEEALGGGYTVDLLDRLERARTKVIAAHDDYTLIRRRLVAALVRPVEAVN
jgi:hypothetical protein